MVTTYINVHVIYCVEYLTSQTPLDVDLQDLPAVYS